MPTPNAPIRAAIVGCGIISNAHAMASAKAPEDLIIVACMDIIENKAVEFAKKYGIPNAYTNYQEMIEREKPELLILSTWPVQHEEQVLTAIALGVKNILCEKSLAMNAASAQRMHEAVRSAGGLLMEGFMWRHHPRTLQVQEMLESNRIGKLRKVRASFQRNALNDPAGSWKHRPECGGGVVYDFTCYCVNAAGLFFPTLPTRVNAVWQKTSEGLITELQGLLEYPDGLVAVIESSYGTHFQQPVELHGENGIIRLEKVFSSFGATEILIDSNDGVDKIPSSDAWQAESQIRHFCECIKNGGAPRFTSEESVRNHAVIDALLESAATRRATTPRFP